MNTALEVKEDGQIWLIPDTKAFVPAILVSNQEVARELLFLKHCIFPKEIALKEAAGIYPISDLTWKIRGLCHEEINYDCQCTTFAECTERLAVISIPESDVSKKESSEKSDNKLIAEFMGDKNLILNNPKWIPSDATTYLKYHTSWDWLIPVVEKIRTLRDEVGDYESGLAYSEITIGIEANGHASAVGQRRAYRSYLLGHLQYARMINATQHTYDRVEVPHISKYGNDGVKVLHEVVVEFIKWYNQQSHERQVNR